MKTEFLESIRSSRKVLFDALAGVDEDVLTTRAICGTWTAKDVLGHIAASDGAILREAQTASRGETPTWSWDGAADFDSWNATQSEKRRDWSLAQVVAELNDNRKALLAELDAWPAEAGLFGPDTWDQEKSPINWIASHEVEHANAVKELRPRPA